MSSARKSLEPWIKDDIIFYKHQIEGVREGSKRRSFILADDMGLGKCLQCLTIFAVDIIRGWAKTAIVIAPPSLGANWVVDIKKFTRIPYVLLDGDQRERTQQLFKFMLIEGPKILIINYEQASIHKAQLDTMAFDIAMYDEAHYIKEPTAQRTVAVLDITARRSFMVTGTPFLNEINEMWCLFHRVDPERFPFYYTFTNRYCVYGGYNNRSIVGKKNEKELIELTHRYMIRRKKEDCLDLPPVQIITRETPLHPVQRTLYDEAFDNLRIFRPDGSEEEIEHAFVKYSRCLQICGTTEPFNGEDISSKLDLCVAEDLEILKTGEKIVSFTAQRPVQAAYLRRIAASGVPVFSINGDNPGPTRVGIAEQWAKVKGPAVFSAMIQVGAEGLNLTAARHGAFIDKMFVPGKNNQAIDRLHRIGQDKDQPVQFRQYLCTKTVETRKESILKRKIKSFDEVINTSDPNWKRNLLKLIMETEDDD